MKSLFSLSQTLVSRKTWLVCSRNNHNQLFNPTPEHAALRATLRAFAENEVDKQALEFNKIEVANWDIFRKLADLGILGLTVAPAYGGMGMDAVAAVIVAGAVFIRN